MHEPVPEYDFKSKNAQDLIKRAFRFSPKCLYLLGDILDNIQDCAKLYETLLRKTFYFTLENNINFKLFFKSKNFAHLVGLHKLKDLKFLKQYSAEFLFNKILTGEIGANEIKNSVFYNRIEDRISYFERIFDMLDVNKSKIIVDYDKSIVSNSKLHNTKYILYREIKSSYLLLTIGDRGKGEYPETLLFEISKKYLTGQQLLDVIDIRIEC